MEYENTLDGDIEIKLIRKILRRNKMRGDEVLLDTTDGTEQTSFEWVVELIKSSRFCVTDVESFNENEFKMLVQVE